MQAWGSGAAIPPPNFAVPLRSHMHTFLNHNNNVAIIGGYAARNMQIIAAILNNAN
jgi:hypothetical protein